MQKRIQGQADTLLNAMGRAQAMAQREGLEIHPLPYLRERHYGIFQGLTAFEGAERYPDAYALYRARDPHYNFETGESMLELAARVAEAVDWMVRHHAGRTIAAVTHGGMLDILYRRATGRPLHTPRDFDIPNCALNWFRFDAHGWHLEAWADRHHLETVLVETPE